MERPMRCGRKRFEHAAGRFKGKLFVQLFWPWSTALTRCLYDAEQYRRREYGTDFLGSGSGPPDHLS